MSSVDLFGPVLTGLLGCAVDACASRLENPPARAFTAVGEISMDDCCDGQVWARLVNIVPKVDTSPTGSRATSPCGPHLWVATVGLGMVRCAVTIDDNMTAPDPGAISAESLEITEDASALAYALTCCWMPDHPNARAQVDSWLPYGPAGGCVGGEWLIRVFVSNCRCD